MSGSLRSVAIAGRFGMALCFGLLIAINSHAAESAGDANLLENQKDAAAKRWCRVGAFIDALKLMNGIMSARDALQTDIATRAMAELGGMLGIAIKQAKDEYSCVEGTLVGGYHAIYATTVKRAAVVAQAMRLGPDVVATAHELAGMIEATGAPK